jgi:CBS domain-containing protein
LILAAETAAELMSDNPVSIRADATVAEAIALLTDKNLSAAPVIDDSGRPIGVLSRADILIHEREQAMHPPSGPGMDPTRARDLMTPAVFSVTPETPAGRVVEEMVALNVHQLFVVDHDGSLIGVIRAHDVLRALRP